MTKDLAKIYLMGKVRVMALDGINISIDQGEFVAIMGPSGSGKSTFLNMVGLLDTHTSGEILVNGTNVTELNDDKKIKFRLDNFGFVFQFFSLFNQLNALENVIFPMMLAAQPNPSRRANKLLEDVGLGNFIRHKPYELSGGQQQRVAIARALANNPKILLADEPTGHLDRKSSYEIMALFKQLNIEHGVTIIIVTHDHEIGEKVDRIIKFRDGKIDYS
ncbi:MAG: ABC transporter ATP-binding protein [Candidatus Methanoperedens sp.]|nr:ABC transporter ATP-binding protein [Candidatus Methanoperedens sp.]MCZ7371867.1 ABC transporter ATP-binding protein [Candidatus Methanoperedens sp.]